MSEKFTRQVSAHLDESVEALDPELKRKLAAARRAAVSKTPEFNAEPKRKVSYLFRPVVYWPALAAALLAVVVLPNFSVPTHAPIDSSVDVHSLYDVDPELLDTMDLLWAVEDLAEREMHAL